MRCPYCDSEVRRISSLEFYGRDFGTDVIACSRFPVCDSYVGCHANTGKPLGTLANEELRWLRNNAHSAFDPFWKQNNMTRKEAYFWLAQEMNIDVDKCHIAMFDEKQCRKVIEICMNKKLKGAV